MFDVFLSHSSIDKEKVRELVEQLRNEGIIVWFDEEQIKPGDSVFMKIEEGLAKSRWIVLTLSRAAIQSGWVMAEVASKFHHEKWDGTTRIIPVLLEELEKTLIPYLLVDKHLVYLTRPSGLKQLVERVRKSLSLREYCNRVHDQPITPVWFHDYHIEPSDLLRVALREVTFLNSDPHRVVRTNDKSLTVSELILNITATKATYLVNVFVILGEAGVGKTTTSKLLCHLLAEGGTHNTVPLYIPLGECQPDKNAQVMLNQFIEGGTFQELVQLTKDADKHLIIVFDGLNEQTSKVLDPLIATVRHRIRHQQPRTSIIMTSRPVISLRSLWQGDDIRFFELRRWTKEQLARFFEKNSREYLLSQVPDDVLNCLRLPLLAALVTKKLNEDESLASLRTISDMFESLLDHFLNTIGGEKEQNLSYEHRNLRNNPRRYIEKMAYQMTMNKTVQTEGRSLENVLTHDDKKQFKFFMARLVNSGLLRCSNSVIAVDPHANVDELRTLKIGFLHQALQEYLTALWITSNSSLHLPPDVSHDIFWREVPIYIIHNLDDPVMQEKFVLCFLGDKPDYLTAARLVQEIADPGRRKKVRDLLCERLISNIKEPGLYPYAIETFFVLGNYGRGALRECLRETKYLEKVFAKFEAHLLEQSVTSANEVEWRSLGRSVYLLGELGDFWLAEYLACHLDSILSLHLLYHTGEALLTLARMSDQDTNKLKVIFNAGRRLGKLTRRDPVTRGYSYAVIRACGGKSNQRSRLVAELKEFLNSQAVTERQHFKDEFWRRAHGVESFAELADSYEGIKVLMNLFEAEDRADYTYHEELGYKQVQSSILKAVLRLCNSYPNESADWHPLLESILMSKRVADNGWACRHLERLLLTRFSKSSELQWIKSWKESAQLGGARIYEVLSNVIWLSS